jgi:PhnB protein
MALSETFLLSRLFSIRSRIIHLAFSMLLRRVAMAKTISRGSQSIVPSITVHNGAAAIEFYKKAFGAEVQFLMTEPGGPKIAYCELRIGNNYFSVNDEVPQQLALSPITRGGPTGGFNLYVDDCDAIFKQAVAAGATAKMPPMDMFWGDRLGAIDDPFGHRWGISTFKEELSPEEVNRRRDEMMKAMANKA